VTAIYRVGRLAGDVRYMSPEQMRGEQVTEQSDVYAFGILAYEVLVGRGPYEAKAEAQMITAHLQREPLKLRELRGDVEAAVAALIERCLAKDPHRKPRNDELDVFGVTHAGLVRPVNQDLNPRPREPHNWVPENCVGEIRITARLSRP
jgi:eukaryotic-like serine/threonine-protein kinase